MLKRLNLLKFYYNKNENLVENLYDTISLVKIKKEFYLPLAKNL